jgi:cellulose biosynthesis protein BcsQ
VLFLDCAPGISLLSENVLHAADAIIVPLLPTPLSVRMLVQLQDFIAAKGWTDLMVLPFFSMVDRRKALHLEIIAATRKEFPEILATEIPYWSEIERMSQRRAPLCAYAPHSPAGAIYAALWQEIQSRMGDAALPVAAENELPTPPATVILSSPLIPTPVEPS